VINLTTLEDADLDDQDTVFELPGSKDETILLAYCLQRWTACPWFKNENAVKEIGRQFEAATKSIYNMRPQNRRARRIVPVR